jgi:hypothetical protein
MTFAKRQINLQFSNADSVVNLDGLRCHAVIQDYVQNDGALELRVWGMTLDQMNQFSSVGSVQSEVQSFSVALFAGNEGGAIAQVFSGGILRSYIDFSAAPEVCFVVSAVAGLYDKVNPSASNSYPGSANAEDLIASLAAQAGYGFTNNGAHGVVQNQYVSGSLISQMRAIARAAALPMSVTGVSGNGMISIWPNHGEIDTIQIDLGPNTGMVGYPTYWDAGFIVKSEFNPMMRFGRIINLTSVIPKAIGLWPIQEVTHEISTLMPDGPWFSVAKLSNAPYVPTN